MAAEATTTAAAINHLVDKIGDGLGQISGAISSHAPQAWELVVQGAYADAAATLITGVALIPAAVLAALGGAMCARTFIAEVAKPWDKSRDSVAIPCLLGGLIFGVTTAVTIIAVFTKITDAHAWAMIVSPQGTVARDLLMRAL